MPLLTATISGAFLQPDLGPGSVTVWIEATSDGSRLTYPGQVIQGRNAINVDANGNASITLPQLPQTSMSPPEAVWRLVWHPSTGEQTVFEFTLTADTTWDDLVDVSGVPMTSSLVAQATAARDAAQGYASSAAGSVSLVAWAPSTSYTAGDIRQLPDGTPQKRATTGTSRSSFDATEQGAWTPLVVKVGYTNHSIMEYAAGATINDGTTSASTAITNALAAIPSGKQRLHLPPGIYLDDAARTLTKSVEIVGDGATIKKGSTVVSTSWWTLNADDIRLVNLTIDDSGSAVTGNLFNTGTGKARIQFSRNTITAPAAIAIRTVGVTDALVEDNTILACKRGIQILSTSLRPKVRNNTVTGWTDFGIYIVGDASGASTGLQLSKNVVSGMTFGGSSRYPITIQLGASATVHSAPLVEGNSVFGAGTAFTATSSAGNADCFGLFGCDGLRVIGNLARDGGDMGITIDSTNPQTKIVISGNVCENNDTGGIAIASGAKHIAISGNVLMNNGQNRNADRNAVARTGIWLSTASNVAISGNVLGDDQATKTQQYGVTFNGTVTNVSLGPDVDAGNALATYFKGTGTFTSNVKVTTAAF